MINVDEEQVVDETAAEEELEANDEDNALDTEETASDEEAEQVETGEDNDAGDERRGRAKAHIDRLKEENRQLKERLKEGAKGGEKGGQEGLASNELLFRTYLGQQGYTNRDVQDAAIERAKKLGLSVDQMLADPDEKAFLDIKAQRIKTTQASSRPTGKGGGSKKDAKWYADNNVLPDDPAMRVEVWNLLADRDR